MITSIKHVHITFPNVTALVDYQWCGEFHFADSAANFHVGQA